MAMSDDLKAIEAQVAEGVAKVTSMEELEKLRVSVTGKKGQLTAIMRMMGKLAPEERPAMGQLASFLVVASPWERSTSSLRFARRSRTSSPVLATSWPTAPTWRPPGTTSPR